MLQSIITNDSLQVDNDISLINATYYYRWSTTGQIKERKFRNNRIEYDEKKIIHEAVNNLEESIKNYRGYCSVCNKEIRTYFVGDGYLDKGKTGRKLERESIELLLNDAKEGKFKTVFTPFSSRIGRNRAVSTNIREQLKDQGIQIYSIHQPVPLRCPECFDPLDNDTAVITETYSDMQAELEVSQIRRNYKNGMPVRIKDGKPSGCCSYGLMKKITIVGEDQKGNDQIEERYEWDQKKS